jgi:predicted nucleic acid-binding protein
MNIVVDSFAWIELFKGTTRGKRALDVISEEKNTVYTTYGNYYELYYRLTQEKGQSERDEALAFLRNQTNILEINQQIAEEAGEIRLQHGLSAIDAFTLAAARQVGGKVLTGDRDFDKFKDEIIRI